MRESWVGGAYMEEIRMQKQFNDAGVRQRNFYTIVLEKQKRSEYDAYHSAVGQDHEGLSRNKEGEEEVKDDTSHGGDVC
jgi:hypothetical protein